MSDKLILQFENITKSFSGVPVLRDVSLAVPAGHTFGLVGENGAGKSTLMNILGGNLRSDLGRILLDGQPFSPRNPSEAARCGLSFIHQELNLFPNLSIAENLFITAFPNVAGLPVIDQKELRNRATALLEQVGLIVAPEILVERLSAGERQLVEIAKALSMKARIIILDEPATSLSARETEALFVLMGRLRQEGITMLYISHNLGDVLRLCDDIAVLRDGEVVGWGPRSEFESDRIITLMVGRSINQFYPTRTSDAVDEPVLDVRNLSQPGILRDVSFTVRRGEVLGVAGLMGAGRTELARILFGLDPCEQGEVRLMGRLLCGGPRARIERGMALLTENRREEGLCLEASIADNIALVSLRQRARSPLKLVDEQRHRSSIANIRSAVRLSANAADSQPASTLSGGNQQKVVLAKWLLADPRVLLLDEPTRGIDVGAKCEIYQLINELASRGAGILVISSEIEELMGICDRIVVMCQGEIRDCLSRSGFDRERILRAALPDVIAL